MTESLDISCKIKDLGSFRIDSFNYAIHSGLEKLCLDIDPVYTSNNIKVSVSDVTMRRLHYPMDTRKHRCIIYPSEARLRAITYYAQLDVQLCIQKDGDTGFYTGEFYVPVMVKSDLCFLNGFNKEELIKVKEDFNDPGGYFIVNGNEILIRHFLVPKRNYPLALAQRKWKKLKKNYTEYGILVRSVKDEHIFSTLSLHYLDDGTYEIRVFYNLKCHYIQLMLVLKALVNESDAFIVKEISKYNRNFPTKKIKVMLRDLHEKKIYSHEDAKSFIGKKFHSVFKHSREATNSDVADHLFRKSLLVHLDKFEDKFQFLCFSLCKLHCTVTDRCRLDDLDNPVYQEVLSTGQIYLLMLKEGILKYQESVRGLIQKLFKNGLFNFSKANLRRCCYRKSGITHDVTTMISTGSFAAWKFGLRTGTGYTIYLQRTNGLRLASQFTAICKFPVAHFLKMTRGYYPESYGFLCPTQTPEGENAGLYNYLASQCQLVNLTSKRIEENILFNFGVVPYDDPLAYHSNQIYPVFVDGKITGWISSALIGKLLYKLRQMKASDSSMVPYHSEIVCVQEHERLFPGIFLFSSPCRMVRKLFNEYSQKEEYVGILECLFLGETLSFSCPSYTEVASANILGLSARMIPYCEYNYGVRNIYSSEKSKQALGLPFLNFNGRSDTKTYQLLYSQSAIVSTKLYEECDFYPYGTNVIVAVISYSGYDMEDALVLNKASVERGLMHNLVYQTFYYDLEELAEENDCTRSGIMFKRNSQDPHIPDFLDEDGLPHIGRRVRYNDPILSLYCKEKDMYVIKRYLERHDSYVHSVRVMGTGSELNGTQDTEKLSITFCIRKIPEVGDKFNNRHCGKCVCGALMREEDVPFSENGLVPDILFNPHGLPSRMPIGMLFEMAKAKISIHEGRKYVVEPFESGSKVYEDIGEAFKEAGLSYYGTEKFYSGISGLELEADVFCGSMYYLRLHHMVEDKYQVQSIGPVDDKTFQPINPGRSGAVRFGEMERDAILSHGAMKLTLDRLLINSDQCTAYVCLKCHHIIFPILPNPELRPDPFKLEATVCTLCDVKSHFKVRIPYALCYLISELSVLGISVILSEK